MTTIFQGDTNGGANRFFVDENGDILVSGEGVGGQPIVSGDPLLLAEIWDATLVSTGDFSDDGSAANIVTAQENGIAKIGGLKVGGQYRFRFDTQEEAQDFIDFIKEFQGLGLLASLLEGDPIPSEFLPVVDEEELEFDFDLDFRNIWGNAEQAGFTGALKITNTTGETQTAYDLDDLAIDGFTFQNIWVEGQPASLSNNRDTAGAQFGDKSWFDIAPDETLVFGFNALTRDDDLVDKANSWPTPQNLDGFKEAVLEDLSFSFDYDLG